MRESDLRVGDIVSPFLLAVPLALSFALIGTGSESASSYWG